MSSHSIRREHGFLDTGRFVGTPAVPRASAVREFLMEAGDMLRGSIEAPLRRAGRIAGYRELEGLQDDLKKDIGLDM